MQTDFTYASVLGITIAGEPFPHLLSHSVLPYSNWESATVCLSESMAALKRGVQTAVFELGAVPEQHQTDHSTAATHREMGTAEVRRFNQEYEDFCDHFGMTPRTIQVGAKEQNGDIESANGALKRYLEQYLLLRGSRDFGAVEEYEDWVRDRCRDRNRLRTKRLAEELAVMRPLPPSRVAEYSSVRVGVTTAATIRVKGKTYSVPSLLRGEQVDVRLYEQVIEVYYAGELRLTGPRLRGKERSRIQYHHVIDSLVRKPGAFARYRYREDLFPDQVYRQAHEALTKALPERKADLHYLRVLQLAAQAGESLVRDALVSLATEDRLPVFESVQERVVPDEPEVPDLPEIPVDLRDFDGLLEHQEVGR